MVGSVPADAGARGPAAAASIEDPLPDSARRRRAPASRSGAGARSGPRGRARARRGSWTRRRSSHRRRRGKVVRSTSWRRTISPSARSSAAASSGRRAAAARRDVVDTRGRARARSRNQSRSCANGERRRPPREARHERRDGALEALARARLDAPRRGAAIVGASKMARSGARRRTPPAARAMHLGWPSSEWPPSSKKSSCDADPLDAEAPRPRARRAPRSAGVRGGDARRGR